MTAPLEQFVGNISANVRRYREVEMRVSAEVAARNMGIPVKDLNNIEMGNAKVVSMHSLCAVLLYMGAADSLMQAIDREDEDLVAMGEFVREIESDKAM